MNLLPPGVSSRKAGRSAFLKVEKHVQELKAYQASLETAETKRNDREKLLRGLFDICRATAKKSPSMARQDKQRSIESGRGFDNWGFYKSQVGWMVYEKGPNHNSKIDWFKVATSYQQEIENFFSQ